MADKIIDFFSNFDPYLATALMSIIPFTELRASIPAAYGLFDIPMWQIFIIAVASNIIPAVFIVWLLEPLSGYLMQKSKFFEKFFNWLFERTRKKFYKKYEKWGNTALTVFVAIPLPVTGAWTGAIAAFLFGIPLKKAVPLIFTGLLIAATVITLITIGAFSFI